ncbi:hemerythrin [Paramagnetospirillum kuznetsovii]|uniref:Hemerythrin n=2 Tax=Paramagnetospirillum kuznetsovii TaxID=2053833 RepID=A0A364NT15_9PROT|nr:hemerythrin [Paramagnetospirillum kuznetsovii]
MQSIQWDPSFSVGIAKLDDDHKKLIQLINSLYEAWNLGKDGLVIGSLFDALQVYTDSHFQREEAVLLALEYDRMPQQQHAHACLVGALQNFRTRYLAGGQATKPTAEMNAFLRSWLLDHILTEDLMYRALLASPESLALFDPYRLDL